MRTLSVALLGAVMAGGAAAQSSVALYGIIDLGPTWYNGGQRQWRLDSGIAYGSRLGFRGTEDLGGGTAAVFDLEMGIAADSGGNTLSFNRESWMGFRNNRFGTVTLGRQTDFMLDFLTFLSGAPFAEGAYSFHPGDYDRVSGVRYDNSIKFTSSQFGGFRFGAHYALGEVAGDVHKNAGRSFGVQYDNGKVYAAAVYTRTNDQVIDPRAQLGIDTLNGAVLTAPITTRAVEVWGAGAGTRFGPWWIRTLLTRAKLETPGGSPTLPTIDVNTRYDLTPNSFVAAGFAHSKLENHRWKKFFVAYDYALSKRTDLSVTYTRLKANAGDRAVLLALPPSSTNTATAVRFAITHKF